MEETEAIVDGAFRLDMVAAWQVTDQFFVWRWWSGYDILLVWGEWQRVFLFACYYGIRHAAGMYVSATCKRDVVVASNSNSLLSLLKGNLFWVCVVHFDTTICLRPVVALLVWRDGAVIGHFQV